jgi:hypothetical protein
VSPCVAHELSSRGQRKDLDTQLIGQLPGNEVREMTRSAHRALKSIAHADAMRSGF